MTASNHQRSNSEWIQALRGDMGYQERENAAADLFQLIYLRIYNYLRIQHRNGNSLFRGWTIDELEEEAKEHTQEIVLKFFYQQLYEHFRDDARFSTFVFRIATNHLIDVLRRRGLETKRGFVSSETENSGEPTEDSSSSDPVVSQILQELFSAIENCIDNLNEQRGTVLRWAIFDELPKEEIAQRLEKTKNAIYGLLFKARQDIQECLAEKGWTIDEMRRLFD
ncbi:MAG: RNA polymerase sigma factor [Chloroflexota bacterium]